ncbi:MAG: LysR family transcriptional regulator [Pseudomonadota bacterium]
MENFDQLNLTGKQLLLFLSVYDSNSVGKAAVQLGLNQSTVSYGLDRLREAFRDALFIKSGRGIVATDRAVSLAPTIRSIVENLEGLGQPGIYDPAEDGRQIVIAANVMELLPTLNLLHGDLHKLAPNSEIRFLELGSRDNIKDLLDQNSVDAVISVKPRSLANSLNSTTIYRNEIVCFFDENVREPIRSIEDFAAAEHAALDFGGASKSTIDLLLEDISLDRMVKLRAPNAFALGDMMRGTALVASMQESLQGAALAGLATCPHPLNVPEAVFDLIWHQKTNNTPRGTWLRNAIISRFREADPGAAVRIS